MNVFTVSLAEANSLGFTANGSTHGCWARIVVFSAPGHLANSSKSRYPFLALWLGNMVRQAYPAGRAEHLGTIVGHLRLFFHFREQQLPCPPCPSKPQQRSFRGR